MYIRLQTDLQGKTCRSVHNHSFPYIMVAGGIMRYTLSFIPLFILPRVLAAPTFSADLLKRDDPPCNGTPALCNRKYSNITFLGTHDSAFVGPLPTQNQIKSVSDQLNSGIRFLQAQTHSWLGGQWLCHTSCLEVSFGVQFCGLC